MIVVGLDMATTTGVCLGQPGQAPSFWSEDLGKGLPHQQRLANALRLGHRLINQHGVDFIGIEAPIIVPKRDRKANNELLMGLIACIRGWAEMKGVHCETFEISAIDKHFLGRRSTSGRNDRKAAIRQRCHTLGWRPNSDDEADAGAVFDLACSKQSHSHAVMTAPLIAAGRGR